MTKLPSSLHLNTHIPSELAGTRLDQALAQLFPEHSRMRLKQWVQEHYVTVNNQFGKPSDKVKGGEKITISVPSSALTEQTSDWQAQELPLSIIYEDDDILIINKPAGVVVHPASGNRDGTLLNALLHHIPAVKNLPRAGIVHRLDKDTSGLLVIAKSLIAHTHLVKQLQARDVKRAYLAVVKGVMIAGSTIDAPIGRHPTKRTHMAILESGKQAITHYRVKEKFRHHTLVDVSLDTGRTHQIRVHLAHIRYPIVGDMTYGGRLSLPGDLSPELINYLRQFKRQALHAYKLGLIHPTTQQYMEWECPVASDIEKLINLLQKNNT